MKRFLSICIGSLVLLGTSLPAQDTGQPGIRYLQPLTVTPREVDLGNIEPGKAGGGSFTIQNSLADPLPWSVREAEGWTRLDAGKLTAVLREKPQQIRVEVRCTSTEMRPARPGLYTMQMSIDADSGFVVAFKELPAGVHRETIWVVFPDGEQGLQVLFRIGERETAAVLDVDPLRLVVEGVAPGAPVSRKIRVTNRGRELLHWKASPLGNRFLPVEVSPLRGRFVSFLHEEGKGGGSYTPPPSLRETLELAGRTSEQGGCPALWEEGGLTYRLHGTGVSLLLLRGACEGRIVASVDKGAPVAVACPEDDRGNQEVVVAEHLAPGPHVLTVQASEGRVGIEGVRILGTPPGRGPSGWIRLFPDEGTCTVETDYVNVTIATDRLVPGTYGEYLVFQSNGGDAVAEVIVDVAKEQGQRIIDIYRYVRGGDVVLTNDPRGESSRMPLRGYERQGLAFRLFPPGTPGTTDFYRWHHPQRKDRFYSYDPKGGGKNLQGYVLEGTIGSIATSRLTQTRPLYRWYHPKTRCHFFTTDIAGEGWQKKGYRYDGIAGYVR